MLSVYSRHYPPCPSDDINYKRCRCPKWINGILGSDGPFIRRSAKTRSWEKAEDFKRRAGRGIRGEAERDWKRPPAPEPALVTVKEAVARFLNSKRNENLADSTLDKLTTIFEKQFLVVGYFVRDSTHITEITTADLEGFRDTWTDGPLAKKKKQERLIGFFYYCLRLGWIKSNPAVLLGSNQSRWASDGLLSEARVRQDHGRNLHLSAQRLGGMPKSSDTASHSDVAHALEWTGNQGRRHPGTAPAERTWRIVSVSRQNRQSCLRSAASGCGGGIEKYSARPQSQSAIFLLVWQRFAEVSGWQLAAKLSTTLQDRKLAPRRRIVQALPSAHVSGHIRGRDAACRSPAGTGLNVAWSQEREDHREALRAVGQGAAGAACGQRPKVLDCTSMRATKRENANRRSARKAPDRDSRSSSVDL